MTTNYDRVADRYDSFYSSPTDKKEDEVVKRYLLGNGQVLNLLDLGCGTGAAVRLIHNGLRTMPRHYTGIDVSGAMLDNWWTTLKDGEFKMRGARKLRWPIIDSGLHDTDQSLTIDLIESKMPCEIKSALPFDMVTALWSMNYLTLDEMRVQLKSAYDACYNRARLVMVVYSQDYEKSSNYICGAKSERSPLPHNDTVIEAVKRAGWKVLEVEPLTGPLSARLPAFMYRVSSWVDRLLFDTWKHRFILIFAVKEEL